MSILIKALPDTNIKRLGWQANSINDKIAQSLFEALKHSKVKYLDLRSNSITEKIVEEFFDLKLTDLDLGDNCIKASALSTFAKLILDPEIKRLGIEGLKSKEL